MIFKPNQSVELLFSRYYWLQIGLIAIAIVLGIFFSWSIMKGLLLSAALEQERDHYWSRYEKNVEAPLPDTKNLFGYMWNVDNPQQRPKELQNIPLTTKGVQHVVINGKERIVVYDERGNKKLLLVFGESNVNRIIWLFGLAPLIASLILLYSILWFFNRRAHQQMSPVSQLAQTIKNLDLSQKNIGKQPFKYVDTDNNHEVRYLKNALSEYHNTLIDFLERERLFAREVSHELRSPLSVIKGSLQLLIEKDPDNRVLQRMSKTSNEMQSIIDTLLTLARDGIEEVEISDVDLNVVIDQLALDFEKQAEQAHIKIHNQVGHVFVKGHEAITYMILSNVLRNAINYSGGSKVTFTAENNQLMISDDGIGIADNKMDIKGHGIGLKLVERLSRMLGWQVKIETADQQGLRVILEF